MARPHVTPPAPIDLIDQRIQIGDTTAFVSKLNTTQDQFERFSEETDAYTSQLNALGDYLEQRADSADADAAATAADRQDVADDKATVAADRAAVADDKTAVASDRQAVEAAASQVASDQQTVAADKAAVADDRQAVEAAASQVASDASAAAESVDTASNAAQTSQQLRDQTQALRDQAEAIVVDDDVRAVMKDVAETSLLTWDQLQDAPETAARWPNFTEVVGAADAISGAFESNRRASFEAYDLAINSDYASVSTGSCYIDCDAGSQVYQIGIKTTRRVYLRRPPAGRSMVIVLSVSAGGVPIITASTGSGAVYWTDGEPPESSGIEDVYIGFWNGTHWIWQLGPTR